MLIVSFSNERQHRIYECFKIKIRIMIHKNKAEKWGIEPQKVRLLIDMGTYKTQREITVEEYFKKELWRNKKIIQVDLI